MLSAEVFEAITASAGAAACTSASSASFRSIFSGAASITMAASRTASATDGRGRQAAARRLGVGLGRACRARRSWRGCRRSTPDALVELRRRDVVEAGGIAGGDGRMGDAVAHGAGAEDGEGSKGCRHERRTPEWRRGQRPVKRGGRFSRLAASPSAASSLSNSRCCSSRSSASPSAKLGFEPRLHGALDVPDGAAGPVRRRERLGVVDGGVAERAAGQHVLAPHLVDQAGVAACFHREQRAGDHQLHRLGLAHQPRQPLRAAGAGQDAERHLGQANLPGAGAGDAQVGGHRHFEPAADAVPVQRRDHQLRRLLEPVQRLVGVQAEVVLERRIGVLQHADVRPGAEEPLPRPDEHASRGPTRPCARRGPPRPARASSRTSRCWPAGRSARGPRRRRRRRKRTSAGRQRHLSPRTPVPARSLPRIRRSSR